MSLILTGQNLNVRSNAVNIHPTAEIEEGAFVHPTAKVWHYAHIRKGAHIGENTIIGRGVFVDVNVHVGANCKVQNYACLYHGTVVEDGVFVGPRAITTNDKHPRAVNDDGSLKTDDDWQCGQVVLGKGCSLGAGVIVLPDVIVAPGAMIGAGAVVSKSTVDGVYRGVPAVNYMECTP
jgi:UDP-3-O-[3-hydroxymyristoyl] glucosamine N-acyltransferase